MKTLEIWVIFPVGTFLLRQHSWWEADKAGARVPSQAAGGSSCQEGWGFRT